MAAPPEKFPIDISLMKDKFSKIILGIIFLTNSELDVLVSIRMKLFR